MIAFLIDTSGSFAGMEQKHAAVAIIPCLDLDESQAFYERLGFVATSIYHAHGYRILHDPDGASVHLTRTAPGWVIPERNAYGLYFYSQAVDSLAERFGHVAKSMPWGVREFAVSDPSGTLVRIGWPV
jgi:catechol 2,3-dioxygenase-like lactoylglutathione lyase family enzyme